MGGLLAWAVTEGVIRRRESERIRHAQMKARREFNAWVRRTCQDDVVVCLEADSSDIVWVGGARGSRDQNELRGTVRAWALFEGFAVIPCPGHTNHFLIEPRTPDEAFAIRMRWG